jgi:bifunctional DNA-binding transcriptional regulator/antitoxin component of YhaV-PrlF toxin-antitoxin module
MAGGKQPPGFAESRQADPGAQRRGAEQRAEPERRVLKLGPGGRVVIPADFRKAMEVEEGEKLVALLEDGELRLVGHKVAVRKVQEYFRSIVPEEVSLVDELIADRRREAEEEDRDG